MTLSTRGERRGERRSRRRRSNPTSRIAVFSLGFLLILSEAFSLSSADKTGPATSRRSPPRKARFFATPPYLTAPPKPARNHEKSGDDKIYEEDKRLVHTGPNPLHN